VIEMMPENASREILAQHDHRDQNGGEDGARVSFGFAKRHGVLVRELRDGVALVTTRARVRSGALLELRRILKVPLKLTQVGDGEFDRLLQQAYETSGDTMQMMEDLGGDMDLSRIAQALPEPEDLLESQDDAPIIRLINALLTEAIKENASDIHIEPFESRLVVRLRVDGVLREVLQPPRVMAPLLVSRIKVMAKLDIAEKRLPQDASRCASPGVRWTFASPPCPRATASAW
jgi:general secretion pathway protein E